MRNEALQLQVLGRKLRYVDKGSGEPVVLLHGLGADLSVWEAAIDPLASQHRVLAFDQIGFGQSDKPTIPYSASTFYDFLMASLDALGIDQTTLVGNSMGGWIALIAALRCPERIRRLVLVGPAFLYGMPEGVTLEELARRANPATLDEMESYLGRVFHGAAFRSRKEVTRRFADHLAKHDGQTIRAVCESLAAGKDVMTAKTGSIRQPTLILHGRNDGVVPVAVSERLQSELPKAELVIIDDCGHWPQIEKTNIFIKTLRRFLDG